jgi:hypothetical protein
VFPIHCQCNTFCVCVLTSDSILYVSFHVPSSLHPCSTSPASHSDCSYGNTTCIIDEYHTPDEVMTMTSLGWTDIPDFTTSITLTETSTVLIAFTWSRTSPAGNTGAVYLHSRVLLNSGAGFLEPTELTPLRSILGQSQLGYGTNSGLAAIELGAGTHLFKVQGVVSTSTGPDAHAQASEYDNRLLQATRIDGRLVSSERYSSSLTLTPNVGYGTYPGTFGTFDLVLTEPTLVMYYQSVSLAHGPGMDLQSGLLINNSLVGECWGMVYTVIHATAHCTYIAELPAGTHSFKAVYFSSQAVVYNPSSTWQTLSSFVVLLDTDPRSAQLAHAHSVMNGNLVSSNTWTTAETVSFTLDYDAVCMLHWVWTGRLADVSLNKGLLGVRLLLNGTPLTESRSAMSQQLIGNQQSHYSRNLTAGSYTVTLQYRSDEDIYAENFHWQYRTLSVVELAPQAYLSCSDTSPDCSELPGSLAAVCDTNSNECVCSAPNFWDTDSDPYTLTCELGCVLDDPSCNYQPDPPVVTFSDVVIGDDNLAYYRIQMNASDHWDDYVRVVFPNSENNWCDYPASKKVNWVVTRASDNGCTNMYSVDIPVNDFLGKCGFEQQIRNGDSLFFKQTVQIQTNRTCEDGRINQLSLSSDVELSETRSVSRETQYEIEIIAPTNTTAKTGGLEVFGTAFKLDLLGDLTITPDIDTNMPTISGFFVTETQHPYELQDPVFELTGDFNYATFELTGTYCTADNSTRLPCQQTWSYSFQPNQTCPDKAQLEGELVQITWNVNCSDGFIGECAPSFAVQPEATFSLNSPVYCFSSDYIELSPSLEVYQFDQLTVNSADFDAASVGTLTDNGFSVERVFTIDSQLYAEYTVVAAGTGVTLTATTLKKVSTTTSSRGELVLYETNAAEQVITQATTFSVHDSGFGTDESSDFADYRTRFEFTWLNGTTVLLDSTEDLAQTIALSATAISIFTNVQSLRKAGIDERHPVLSKLNSDRFAKEQEDSYTTLFSDGDEPRDSKTTILARLAPASTTTPATSTATSGFVVSPTVAAAGIALIAVVALVAFAVIRRSNNSPKDQQPSLPATSSDVQLSALTMNNSAILQHPMVAITATTAMGGSAFAEGTSLQDIASSYHG